MDDLHGIGVDLTLRTSPWVQASREAQRSTEDLVRKATELDNTINTKLSPHLDQMAVMLGKTAREATSARVAMFGYEESLNRATRASEAFVRSETSRAALTRVGATFARSAASVGAQEFIGGTASRILGPTGGAIVGAGAASIGGGASIAAIIAAIAGALTGKVIGSLFSTERTRFNSGETGNNMSTVVDAPKGGVSFADQAEEDRQRRIQGAMDTIAWMEREAKETIAAKQKETVGIKAELDKQLSMEKEHAAAVLTLKVQQSTAQGVTSSAQFGMATASSPADLERLTLQQVSSLASQGRTAQSGGDQAAARAKFQEAQQLIEKLFASLGSPIDRLSDFQAAISGLGKEIDESFAKSIEDQTTATVDAAAKASELNLQLTATSTEIENLTAKLGTLAEQAKAAALGSTAAFESTANSGIPTRELNLSMVPGFANGGVAHDPRDTIPALLRAGETVLTPEQGKQLAPLLHRIGVPGYADGGFASIIQGTRRFSEIQAGAAVADAAITRAGFNAELNDLMSQGLSYQAASAIIQSRIHLGLPPVFPGYQQTPSIASGLVAGMANGGLAQVGSQSVSIGDINIDYRGGGGTSADARALALELRRLVKRGISKLN